MAPTAVALTAMASSALDSARSTAVKAAALTTTSGRSARIVECSVGMSRSSRLARSGAMISPSACRERFSSWPSWPLAPISRIRMRWGVLRAVAGLPLSHRLGGAIDGLQQVLHDSFRARKHFHRSRHSGDDRKLLPRGGTQAGLAGADQHAVEGGFLVRHVGGRRATAAFVTQRIRADVLDHAV